MLRLMAVRTLLRVASPAVGSRARSSETWTSASATIAATPNCERRVARRVVLCCNAFSCVAACGPAFFCFHTQLCDGPGNHVGDTRVPPRGWLRGPRRVQFVVRMRAMCVRLPAHACTHTLVRGYSACGVKRVWAVEACGGSRQSAAALCVTDVVFHCCSLQVAGLLAAERDHGQATGRRPRISEGAIDSPDEMAARADGWAGTLDYGSALCLGSAHDVVYFLRWMGEAKPW